MIKETRNLSWLEYIVKIFTEAEMAYNTTVFWIFLGVFLGVFFLLRGNKSRRLWILAGSCLFYMWSGIGAFVIILGTAVIVYLATKKMDKIYLEYDEQKVGLRPKEQVALFGQYEKKTMKYLVAAMVSILGIWIFVKVGKLYDFDTVTSLMEVSMGLGIIVPLGISYYTLSAVGYLLDIYWRKGQVEHNFLNLFSAMIYFPHIIQGPISVYTNLINQMKNLPSLDYNRVCYGLQLMLWGYVKKMVVADRLSIYVTTIYANPAGYAGVEIIVAVVLAVFQLYADFSGCMDIVRGISQVIGIELAPNFRQPFFAKSAQEFWSRWHITLGAWTKSYIYMPIAINPRFVKYTKKLKKEKKTWRSSFIKALCPLIAVWTFTGLWHGTGIDYLLWGYYWCTLMILEKELKPFGERLIQKFAIDTEQLYYKAFIMIRTFTFFAVGRMITALGFATGSLYLFKRILTEARFWVLFDGSLYTRGLDQKDFYVALAGVALIIVVDILHERGVEIRKSIATQALPVRWLVYYGGIFLFVIFAMYGPGFSASNFVYGAF